MGLIFDLIAIYREGNSVLHEGRELANSAAWKNRTNAANKLVVVFGSALAIAKIAGYDIYIDDKTMGDIAVGVAAMVAAVNNVISVITSTKIGIKAADN